MLIFAKMAKIFDPVNMQTTEITGARPRERLPSAYSCTVAAKDTAVSWRAGMTIRELVYAVKNKFQCFVIIRQFKS
jgi:hypothetical protein